MKFALALMMASVTVIWAAPHNVRKTRATKVQSLPIPENAKIPDPLPGKSYFRAMITRDVYYVQTGGSISMFVLTNTGVVVVDAPPAIGPNMSLAIKEVTNLPVTYLIYTHSHGDHIGNANDPMFQNAEKVAHEETAKVLRDRRDPARPVPRTTFSGCTRIMNIGGKKFQLDYYRPIHTPGNIFVFMPNEKVLFTADMVTPGSAPYTRLGVAEDIVSYVEAPRTILRDYMKDNSYFFLGGHGRLGTRQDVINQREYLQDVQKNALLAQASVNYMTIAATVEDQNNGDLIFYLFRDAVAQKCADLTSQKWGTILGYTDVYGKSNCDMIMIAQGIDYGTNKVIGA